MKTNYPNLDYSIIAHCKTVDEAIEALEIHREEQEELLEKEEAEREAEENNICGTCNGSGEGMYSDTSCFMCNGIGTI